MAGNIYKNQINMTCLKHVARNGACATFLERAAFEFSTYFKIMKISEEIKFPISNVVFMYNLLFSVIFQIRNVEKKS